MSFYNMASWLGAPVLFALLFAIAHERLRALAIATLVIALPLSLLLAANNNHANALRNFFFGVLLFAPPLLLHAWVVSLINKKQAEKSTRGDA
jgi:hypothetical protein